MLGEAARRVGTQVPVKEAMPQALCCPHHWPGVCCYSLRLCHTVDLLQRPPKAGPTYSLGLAPTPSLRVSSPPGSPVCWPRPPGGGGACMQAHGLGFKSQLCDLFASRVTRARDVLGVLNSLSHPGDHHCECPGVRLQEGLCRKSTWGIAGKSPHSALQGSAQHRPRPPTSPGSQLPGNDSQSRSAFSETSLLVAGSHPGSVDVTFLSN